VALILLVALVAGCGPDAEPTEAPAEEARPTPTSAVLDPEEEEPGDDLPEGPASREGEYDAPPEMQIDTEMNYVATLVTEKGDIVVELFDDRVPETVNNFVFLAREGFYDNTTFHRVLPDFMAQGGDPTGTGMGGPGYTFEDEFHPELSHDRVGTLSMANSGPNTNGSQFFITYGPTTWLDDRHTVFGRVIDGLDVLPSLSPRDPQQGPAGPGDLIETVTITETDEPIESEIPAPAEMEVPEEPTARLNLSPRPPEMDIDTDAVYVATIETEKGEIVVDLNAATAPQTVNNFVFLARQGFYNGLVFHRVEPGFVIQGGDPTGTGQGGPGYVLPAEIELTHGEGAIAMARLPDQGNPRRMSSGSQFYITLDETSQLDGGYTVFGQVTEGMDVVQRVEVGDIIQSITISEE
jgi:peptidylprolyl isomerase/peptidyl-prolyl cis-trans isomerase B (cyclophilin B)